MANSTDDRGFNTVQNSSITKRNKNKTLQKYTVITLLLLFALLVAMLIVMAVGGIISSIRGNSGRPGPDKEKVDWGTITVSASDTKQGPLVLVNNTHEYTFPATNEHLKEIWAVWNTHKPAIYQQSGISAYMESTALIALDAMLADFSAATGDTRVQIRDAYRTLEDQEGKSVAPGFSDHHTGYGCSLKYVKEGTTAGIDFSNDPETYAWILNNCHKYGFVVRYPADKTAETGVEDYTSYFRYVGPAHATYMKENGLCMEEYIEVLKKYTDKKPLSVTAGDGKYYQVYYVAVSEGGATVRYPTNYAYTISGTNEGGVVITVDRSQAINPETDTQADTSASTDTADTAATP